MYDYVIVGAGSAGCVLAGRLSEAAGVSVALLEAGPRDRKTEIHIPAAFPKLFRTDVDWDFRTAAQDGLAGRELYWPRGKVIGGSSSLNAMMWVRGHRHAYDSWAKAGCPGWGYDDLLPYLRRIERRSGPNPVVAGTPVYGLDGPLHVEELRDPNVTTRAFLGACASEGLERLPDLNVPETEGFAQTPVSQHRGRRWSAADAYLRPARRRPGLTVLTGVHATRVVFDGVRATAVEYLDASGTRRTAAAAREVILAAGAVGSPELLLRSGIGDPEHLRSVGVPPLADSPQVGRNLQDHLAVGVVRACPDPVTLVGADKPLQLARYLLTRRGPLTSTIAEAAAFVRTDPALPAPDLELVFAPAPFQDHGLEPPAGHGLTIGAVLLQPASRGSVRLRSAEPGAAPVIDPGYLTEQADVAVLAEGLRRAHRLFAAEPLAAYAGDLIQPGSARATDEETEEFIRSSAETLYHPVGTCRMGDDPESVTDPDLRVRGVHGLRVADASVMPRITYGHTNAPTMAIAERAAELIAAERG